MKDIIPKNKTEDIEKILESESIFSSLNNLCVSNEYQNGIRITEAGIFIIKEIRTLQKENLILSEQGLFAIIFLHEVIKTIINETIPNFVYIETSKGIDNGTREELIEIYRFLNELIRENLSNNSLLLSKEQLSSLKNDINFRIFQTNVQQDVKALPPQPIVKQKPELKINQIALKYAYEGLQITRENGNEIAKEYGHNSGEKLFQRFTYFSSSANRKGKPNLCTPKKLDNKIKLIESIIELLPTDKQERAKDEVSILKKIYEAEYQ